jgi:hypothetical protein
MWTFYCPYGGSIVASVDTKDDTDLGTATLDPVLEFLDENGTEIDDGDDEIACSYNPVCGFQCPLVKAKCTSSNLHSLIVRDYGVAGTPACNRGGGYELTLDVFDQWGNQLSPDEVALGGGPSRGVPDWAVSEGKAPVGPALDDENVPRRSPAPMKLPIVLP